MCIVYMFDNISLSIPLPCHAAILKLPLFAAEWKGQALISLYKGDIFPMLLALDVPKSHRTRAA